MNYCLPRGLVAKFTEATRSGGPLDPFRLADMDSAARRDALTEVLGDADHAKEVNALFEQKLTLKYKYAFDDWINRTSATPEVKSTIIDQINRIDESILNPKSASKFYDDLAEKTLGFQVTKEEAQKLFSAARDAKSAKSAWEQSLLTDVSYKDFVDTARKGGEGVDPSIQDAATARLNYGHAIQDLNDTVSELRRKPNFVKSILMNAWTLPKSLEVGIGHLSAFGVQLWGSWLRPEVWSGFGEQIKYFADEENYKQLMSYVLSHPYYSLASKYKLGITNISDNILKQEEDNQFSFMQTASKALSDKFGTPDIVRASSRGFTGYLDYVRFNAFTKLVDSIKNLSPDELTSQHSDLIQEAANGINMMSGRANIGIDDKYGAAVPFLNLVTFTARKLAADVQMMNPVFYGNLVNTAVKTGDWSVVKDVIPKIVGVVGVTTGILGLVHSLKPFGYTASLNPLDQTGGEITSPSGLKINLWGGERTLVRLVARLGDMALNQSYSMKFPGSAYPTTPAELIGSEIRDKLSPMAGWLTDLVMHKDAVGREFDWGTEVREKLEPIVMKNFIDYYMNDPNKAWTDFPIILSAAGVQVQSPVPPGERKGVTVWGEDYNKYIASGPGRSPVDDELQRLGIKMAFPPQTINGIRLTDTQYKGYIQLSGVDAKQRLEALMASPDWNTKSDEEKKLQSNFIINSSRQTAQSAVFLSALQSGNDIVKKSLDAANQKQLQSLGIGPNK